MNHPLSDSDEVSVDGGSSRFVWSRGAATAIGSLPGTDPVEAVKLALGEVGRLPFLPELPARGAGADMIGRGASLLVALPVEIVASGWRLTDHEGRDARRARDFLRRDLDALQDQGDGWRGPIKVQVPGPWTLAASIELPSGHRIVGDHGATRDLVESLTEGVRLHLAEVRARLPHAQVVLQLDEPSLPAVLAGQVPTASGYGAIRTVAAPIAERGLGDVLAAGPAGARVVHCCGDDVPFALLRGAGANAIAFDASTERVLRPQVLDQLGVEVDEGTSLWLGVVGSTPGPITAEQVHGRIVKIWSALGFSREQLPEVVVPTTACGLAGATPEYARRALGVLNEVGAELAVG